MAELLGKCVWLSTHVVCSLFKETLLLYELGHNDMSGAEERVTRS